MHCAFAFILFATSATGQQIVVTNLITSVTTVTTKSVVTRPVVSFHHLSFSADGSKILSGSIPPLLSALDQTNAPVIATSMYVTTSTKPITTTLRQPPTLGASSTTSKPSTTLHRPPKPGASNTTSKPSTPLRQPPSPGATTTTSKPSTPLRQPPSPGATTTTSKPSTTSLEPDATLTSLTSSSSATSSPKRPTFGLNAGAKAGIGVGATIGVLLIAVGAYYLGRRAKSMNTNLESRPQDNQVMLSLGDKDIMAPLESRPQDNQVMLSLGDKDTMAPDHQPRHELEGRSTSTPELPGFLPQGYRPELSTNG